MIEIELEKMREENEQIINKYQQRYRSRSRERIQEGLSTNLSEY